MGWTQKAAINKKSNCDYAIAQKPGRQAQKQFTGNSETMVQNGKKSDSGTHSDKKIILVESFQQHHAHLIDDCTQTNAST